MPNGWKANNQQVKLEVVDKKAENVVVYGVCREPLSHILFPDDPISHQSAPADWPKKGTFALMDNQLVHVLGEKVHTGRVVVKSGLVLGEVNIFGLEVLDNRPIEALRYKSTGDPQMASERN